MANWGTVVSTISNKIIKQIIGGPIALAHEAVEGVLQRPRPNILDLSLLGKQLMDVGRFDIAGRVFAKWAEIDPKSVMAWSNLGASLSKLKQFDQAKTILEHAIHLDPKFLHARINLCSLLQDMGMRREALDSALEAVKCDPSSSIAFNNLGSALRELGMFPEAKHAFETSLLLSKDSYFPRFNLARIEADTGNVEDAILQFEALLDLLEKKSNPDTDSVRFALAFEYLKTGRLAEGWASFEYGFSDNIPNTVARHPLRKFKVPRWDGTPLNDSEKLLVWREQGVGDEVMFGSCLRFLEQYRDQVVLEVDQRLVGVMQRSFPNFDIRKQYFSEYHGNIQTKTDYHYQIPVGSLCKHFLSSANELNLLGPYLVPDPELKNEFAKRLAKFGRQKKVGICWRSGSLSATRNSNYTLLDDWEQIFSLPNTTFVNLQYGDCEEELAEAERKFGLKVVRWSDVNLKDDLDSVFAIMSNLDAFVSVGTAVVPFAGAVGLSGVALLMKDWSLLGFDDRYPWFPNVTPVVFPTNGFAAASIPSVPPILRKMLDL